MPADIHLELKLPETKLIDAFRKLPKEQREELLRKLQSIGEKKLHIVPSTRLNAMTGVVSLGGDALEDTEALYNEDGN
ncbi:MAG: hypothetical protein A2Z20_04045 [Bdellovibrionales bacterium RBG_16_40_8]|nr:MAG: hypothetical protein A2Z20_04045 [Bdellovibrionales bacterium RBG_16_40_8]